MATPYYLLYHESTFAQGLEWATKYHWVGGSADNAVAAGLALAEAELIHTSVSITRWEWVNSSGVVADRGSLGPQVGVNTGDMMPIHYAALLRLNVSGGLKRPSVRYIHGIPESFTTNGVSSGTFNTARTNYMDIIDATETLNNYVDSDGFAVTGHSFRGWSRRKRMRRKAL